MFRKRSLVILLGLAAAGLLAACGGGVVSGEQPAGSATLSPEEGLGGQVYVGYMKDPQEGAAGLFLHEDGAVTAVIVGTGDDLQLFSAVLTGEQAGQRLNALSEIGVTRLAARNEEGGFDLSITVLGANGRARVDPLGDQTGGIWVGEFNGLPAGLVLLPDGVFYGFAIVEDGEKPVYEALCLPDDLDLSSLPGEITATTCDTAAEVPLTLIAE